MYRFLRKHKRFFFICMLFIFIGLPFFGIGTNYLSSSPQDIVVKINGEKISQKQFDRVYNQLVRQQKDAATPQDTAHLKNQAFNELVRLSVFEQEAKRYGILVPDQELDLMIKSTKAFQKEGQFDPNLYYQTIYQAFGTTPPEFEKLRKKDMAAGKLNQLIAASVHISDADFQQELEKRLATEPDAKKKKEWLEKPEIFRDELRKEESNWVFSDWLGQLNQNLKIDMVSEQFRQSLSAPAPAAPTPGAAPGSPQ